MQTTPLYQDVAGEASEPIYLDSEACATALTDLINRRVTQATAITSLLQGFSPNNELIMDNAVSNVSWLLRDLLGEIKVYSNALHEKTKLAPPMKAVH